MPKKQPVLTKNSALCNKRKGLTRGAGGGAPFVVRADEEAKHGDVMAVKLLARKLGVPKILEATSGQEAAR